MKRLTLFLLMCSLLFTSCLQTKSLRIYSEEEQLLAREGIAEVARLASRAALTYLPSQVESLSMNELLSDDLISTILAHADTPGVMKRAEIVLQALRKHLRVFIQNQYASTEAFITIPEVDNPQAYIQGPSDSITLLYSTQFLEYAPALALDSLQKDAELESAVRSFLSLINSVIRIDAYRNGENAVSPISSIQYGKAIRSTLALFTRAMASEEAVIRSLAINYDSPGVQLFANE